VSEGRKGALALIAGTAALIATMTLHPTGRDFFVPGESEKAAFLTVLAHALALSAMPVLFLGALVLSRRLASSDGLAISALVLYGFSLAAGMAAATLSGLVAPGIARQILETAGAEKELWRVLFAYNGRLNQGFAQVLTVASSAAVILWSAAIMRSQVLPKAAGIYGLIIGSLILLGVVSGHLRLHVHGFGLVVLAQAVWFVLAGVLLWRRPPD
jgi:hypothetical protein